MAVGIVADGAVKVVLAAVHLVAADPLGRLLGVPVWLLIVSGVVLLACGGTEIRYVHSRPMRTCLRLMVAYDSGWVVATLAAVLMASQGSSAGGEVWIGYQAIASLAFAALLASALRGAGRP
ncbi:hypothetical protein AOZ06_25265 [Kibdelosporangium phytohabitans]|uniref:Uncharacterized protein n=2 Tax=Kibdelosporangium phytohabitans TaxID=860235 RepID=A0A0N9IJ04_9PSEU|nr:hypothetical protein AOZ06_25265 [Kibdelosporangium phytohabitans]